ncbi:MAG: hypothetical protein SWY16_06645 [Cyanobacteriota bacterium]|nr:hypothetical protein [Cyanobacteriota bacterium]
MQFEIVTVTKLQGFCSLVLPQPPQLPQLPQLKSTRKLKTIPYQISFPILPDPILPAKYYQPTKSDRPVGRSRLEIEFNRTYAS